MLNQVLGPEAAWAVSGLLIVLKVTAVLVLTSAVLLVLKRASASTRHLVIALALFASLAVPVLALILPAWEVVPTPRSAAFGSPVTAAEPVETQRSIDPRKEAGEAPATARDTTARDSTARQTTVVPVSPARPRSIPSGLVLAWSIVSAGLLVLLLAQVLATTREVCRARPITDADWLSLLAEMRHSLGVRAPVGLRRRATRAMPLVWGFVKPTILLPRDCDAWPAERRRAVLAHELGHVARRDIPVALVSHLACAIHWFNPLAWSLKRRLTLERELACDRLVVDHGVQSASYANHLLETAVAYRRGTSLSPVMAARSQLEGRIMAILESDRHRHTPSRIFEVLVATLVVLTIVPLASLAFASPSPAAEGSSVVEGNAVASTPYDSNSDTARFKDELRRLNLGRSDVDSLLDGLGSESALTRAACAWALGGSGDPRAVEPLVVALRDEDGTVREWAVRSLGRLGDARAVPPLIDQLDDPDGDVREWIVRTLASVGDERAVQPILDRLDDEDGDVREWAVRSLASVGDERTVQPLLDRLDDEDGDVREWAVRSLASVGDERTVQPLLDRLDDEDADVREWAVRSLASVGDERIVQPLLDRLDDEDADVREWAVRSLASVGDERIVQPLLDRLDDEDGDVREWIVRTLPSVGDERIVQALIDRLDDEDGDVREWAARALGSSDTPSTDHAWRRRGPEPLMPGLDSRPPTPGDPQAIAALIRSLESDDAEVREWSARSLGNMGDESAVAPLIDRLRDPDADVREWTIRSLGSLRDRQAVGSLLDALTDSHPQVREWAVRSLGLLQDEQAFMPLIDRLADDSAEVREWTVRALGASGDRRAIEAVSRLRDDEDPEVRRWVERALENLGR